VAEIADRRARLVARLRRDAAHAFVDALGNAARRIVGGGGDLPDLDTAVLFLEQTDVGEGPAGIHTHAPTRHARILIRSRPGSARSGIVTEKARQISKYEAYCLNNSE